MDGNIYLSKAIRKMFFLLPTFLSFHVSAHSQQFLPIVTDSVAQILSSGISPRTHVVFSRVRKSAAEDTLYISNSEINKMFKYAHLSPVSFLNNGMVLLVKDRYPQTRNALISTNNGKLRFLPSKSEVVIAGDKTTISYEDSTTGEIVIHNVASERLERVKSSGISVSDPMKRKIAVKVQEDNRQFVLVRHFAKQYSDTVYRSQRITDSIGRIVWSSTGDAVAVVVYDKFTIANLKVYLYTFLKDITQVDSIDIGDNSQVFRNKKMDFEAHLSIGGNGKTLVFALVNRVASADSNNGVTVWHAEYKGRLPGRANPSEDIIQYGAWSFPAKRYFAITSDSLPAVQFTPSAQYAVLFNPDQNGPSFHADTSDIYLMNLSTGMQKRILIRHAHQYRYTRNAVFPSPTGRYLAYFAKKNLWAYDIHRDIHVNLSKGMPYPVWDSANRMRIAVERPFKSPGWTNDDEEILLYDAFDIYVVNPLTFKFRKITEGRNKKIRYRFANISPFADAQTIDLDKYCLLKMTREQDWESGYALLSPDRKCHTLVFDDNNNHIIASENYDLFLLTRSNGNRYPEQMLLGKEGMKNSKPFSKISRKESSSVPIVQLFRYKNTEGELLQGALFFPAGYIQGRKYPMVVRIYQVQSDIVRQRPLPDWDFQEDRYRDYVNAGYFVFFPDIKHKANNPGISAVECIEAGVRKVIETGMIDAARIGLFGHSFGGFETAFILSHSRLFAAGIAEAGVYDWVGMALTETIARETGYRVIEFQQPRIYGTIADKLNDYLANSPVIHAHKINVPLLNMVGKKDDIVPWTQSLELFNAMRRFGKRTSLVVYENGGHLVASTPEEFADYRRKKLEWWNHYLKGMPAAKWMNYDTSNKYN